MDEKKRLTSLLKHVAVIMLFGISYYAFVRITGLAIPCLFYVVTGKLCPGCGVTRMLVALFQLDFATAFRCNCLLFILLPVFFIFAVRKGRQYVKQGTAKLCRVEQIAILVIFVMVVVFWILRNMGGFPYMRPVEM